MNINVDNRRFHVDQKGLLNVTPNVSIALEQEGRTKEFRERYPEICSDLRALHQAIEQKAAEAIMSGCAMFVFFGILGYYGASLFFGGYDSTRLFVIGFVSAAVGATLPMIVHKIRKMRRHSVLARVLAGHALKAHEILAYVENEKSLEHAVHLMQEQLLRGDKRR